MWSFVGFFHLVSFGIFAVYYPWCISSFWRCWQKLRNSIYIKCSHDWIEHKWFLQTLITSLLNVTFPSEQDLAALRCEIFFVIWGVLFTFWAPHQDGAYHQIQLEWSLMLIEANAVVKSASYSHPQTASWCWIICTCSCGPLSPQFVLSIRRRGFLRKRSSAATSSFALSWADSNSPFRNNCYFVLCAILNSLPPWQQRMLSKTVSSIRKPKSSFLGSKILNDCTICWITNPSILFAWGLFHWRDCRAQKTDKSSTFVLGNFAGCNLIQMFQLPASSSMNTKLFVISKDVCPGSIVCTVAESRSYRESFFAKLRIIRKK